ncbi:hypothetical protein [Cellulosimicrobium sp. NPDC057862]|uniref:hypothetical protein n=1 Tax=Actinomycetes TaxID=1760 RepID=UPI00366DCD4E
MPAPDTIQGIDLPTYDDPPAIPDDVALIWYAMISRGVPRFSNTAARDAAYPSPTTGQLAWVNGLGLTLFAGTLPWRVLYAVDAPTARFERASASDQSFSATGDTVLVSGTANLPPGRYRVEGAAILYAATAIPGRIFITVGSSTVRFRYDVAGGSLASGVPAWLITDHPGGPMTIALGYAKSSATNPLTVTGAGSGITFVQAERVGP